MSKLTKAVAREEYCKAIAALGDPEFWRQWKRDVDLAAVIWSVKSNRVGRSAGRSALTKETADDR